MSGFYVQSGDCFSEIQVSLLLLWDNLPVTVTVVVCIWVQLLLALAACTAPSDNMRANPQEGGIEVSSRLSLLSSVPNVCGVFNNSLRTDV